MRGAIHGRIRQQFNSLRRQFLQDGDLPFSDVLSDASIAPALEAIDFVWKDRIYTPLVTLWVFLSQVISADHSCRAAVARLITHRIGQGLEACSAKTGAYCQARKRLPEEFFSTVTRRVGRALDASVDPKWLWRGRRVYLFDGTTVTMPDTPENQQAYPQVYNQRPGLGFPMARVCAIMSLSCGSIIDLAIGRYAGKGQGELGLLRTLIGAFRPGDIMLADRLMCSWAEMASLFSRGVDCVVRHTNHRKVDFRCGLRLGKDDRIVEWPKRYPRTSADREFTANLPSSLRVRICRVQIARPGFRSKVLVIATTLLDPVEYPKEELASLYRQRWHAELDIRSIKQTLQMDILRCKTPDLARKEIWTHVLAYNLIRTIMAQASAKHDLEPRSVSFKGTLQTLEAFQPMIDFQAAHRTSHRIWLYQQLLDAVALHQVADRPDRLEPRYKKKRYKKYYELTMPRNELKQAMLKGHI